MLDLLQPFHSVRYVKNGRNGRWWKSARENAQIHAGWRWLPAELLAVPNFLAIESVIAREVADPGAAKRDYEQVRLLLDQPSRHLWITFEDGFLWWCIVKDGAIPNPGGEGDQHGHFWLSCEHPWSNHSIDGRLLAMVDLPGSITLTAGFRGTVCVPSAEQEILRVLRDEKSPAALAVADARAGYEKAIEQAISDLGWKDFELLIDLILTRTGWMRISSLGKTQKAIDIAARNAGVGETAFVQVKSRANQSELDGSIREFGNQRDLYARMIFAVHDPSGPLVSPADPAVQLWTVNKLAMMVVQVGLGEWVEGKLA